MQSPNQAFTALDSSAALPVLDASGWEVPAWTAHELKPKQARYAVVIPVINEGERIRIQMERMRPYSNLADILLVDGGSSDGSTDPAVLQRSSVRTLLRKREGRSSFGMDLRIGFAYAMKEGYSGIILMDGNNKDNPAAIPRFIEELESGFDYVQGSRFLPGGKAENTPFYRWFAIRFVHAPVLSAFAGFRYTDTTNGFRAIARRVLLDPRVKPFRNDFQYYELPYYLAVRVASLKFRMKEIPVERVYPAQGPAPTKITVFRGNFRMLAALFKTCFRLLDPKDRV